MHGLVAEFSGAQVKMFTEEIMSYEQFRKFLWKFAKSSSIKTQKSRANILEYQNIRCHYIFVILTQKYDIAVTNPPYTDSSDFGPELKSFIEDNYKNHINLMLICMQLL